MELTCRAWNQDIAPIDTLSIYVFRLLTHIPKPTTVPIWLNIYLISAERCMSPRVSHFRLYHLKSVLWNANGAMVVYLGTIK